MVCIFVHAAHIKHVARISIAERLISVQVARAGLSFDHYGLLLVELWSYVPERKDIHPVAWNLVWLALEGLRRILACKKDIFGLMLAEGRHFVHSHRLALNTLCVFRLGHFF